VEQSVFVKLHAREGQEKALEEALREVLGPSRGRVGVCQLSLAPFHARPAPVLDPFAVGGRAGLPEARHVAAYGVVLKEGGPLIGRAPRGVENGNDCVTATGSGPPEVAEKQAVGYP